MPAALRLSLFFFNDTATTEIYTLSLHDALPIYQLTHPPYQKPELLATAPNQLWSWDITKLLGPAKWTRSEEHTSELQSRLHLVCRLLLEKKKNQTNSS